MKRLRSLDGIVSVVACASDTTCALLTTGEVRCFGSGASGLLGNGSVVAEGGFQSTPSKVDIPGTVRGISGGGEQFCTRLAGPYGLACWGANDVGQAGSGSVAANQPVPTLVAFPR